MYFYIKKKSISHLNLYLKKGKSKNFNKKNKPF